MATSTHKWQAIGAVTGVLLLLATLLAADPSPSRAQSTSITDALQVVKAGETPSTSDLSVLLSLSTPLPDTTTVVMGRSDVFADSLASGVLQADSPLLLVPPQGPIPDSVMTELARLDPNRIILLGGDTAIGSVVEDQLASSYEVERRAGQTRIETAVEIARRDAPAADTVILSRAFPAPGGDDTQAFADALAAGGMSAQRRWPVLLTGTDSLAESTRAYLATAPVREVAIVGGTSAISQQVEDQLNDMGLVTDRLAGPTRFDTAVAVAGKLGATGADDVDRVTLVEATGENAWAGGFAAAAHSALYEAPIVLAAGVALPDATNAFLAANVEQPTFAVPLTDLTAPVLTCVTPVEACESARIAVGLPPSATVTFDPVDAATLTPGQDVTVTVTEAAAGGPEFAQDETVEIDGTCLDGPSTAPLSAGSYTVTTSTSLSEPCTVEVSIPLSNGSTQRSVATYPGGTIRGVVRSATTGSPIGGAVVTLSNSATTSTDAAGEFTFSELPGGSYRVSVTANGFIDNTSVSLDVAAAQETTTAVLLSPQLAAGNLRIVLSWDDDPPDLDSHLWTPAAEPYHLYYSTDGALDSCPFAALDIDDTSGFGPETITISQAIPGSYRYAVHRFSGSQTLSQSTAQVQVFDTDGLVAQFKVPENGTMEQNWWYVFDADIEAGTVTPINRLAVSQADVEPYPEPFGCSG